MSDLENKHGYLLLSYGIKDDLRSPILIKANKITTMTDFNGSTRIDVSEETYEVMEDMDEILQQLENIHPSLR